MTRPSPSLAVVTALLGLACGAADPPTGPSAARPAPELRPYSVQLHVHGSFSEGTGSMDWHSAGASRLGLDVLWWSDHDHRIASYHHASRYGFEGMSEPIARGESWRARGLRDRHARKGLREERGDGVSQASFSFDDEAPFEGARSLRVSAASPARDWSRMALRLGADRFRQRRSLATRVVVRVAVRPERLGPDARAFVEVALSVHAPRPELPEEPLVLHYALEGDDSAPRREGSTLFLPLAYREGEWNDYALDVTRDAVRGFPFLDGEDNALHTLRFGVEARGGAAASARFDALRIDQELSGPAAYAKQRVLLERLAEDFPGLRQHQGVEISYLAPHLNEFSVDTPLLDYDRLAEESGAGPAPDADAEQEFAHHVARRAVALAHERGGLVSYNHPFSAKAAGADLAAVRPRERTIEKLIETAIFGADLLEVGYRERGGHDLEDHLWLWDELARRGLFPVGVGTSDSHGPVDRALRNDFVSWIRASSTEKRDLIEGLRAGRVFFGDLALFDGDVALRTRRGARMGQIALTDRDAAELELEIEGLAAGDRVRLIASGRPVAEYPVRGSHFRGEQRLALDPHEPTAVRLEVRDAGGGEKVFSNPVVFVRRLPEAGLPAARAALDVAGIASRSIAGFRLFDAAAVEGGGLRLAGVGEDGRIELDVSPLGAGARVRLEGLRGSWSREGSIVRLSGLEGSGAVVVSRGD